MIEFEKLETKEAEQGSIAALFAEELYRNYLGPKLKENAENAAKVISGYFANPDSPQSAHIVAAVKEKVMLMEQEVLILAVVNSLHNVGYKLNSKGRLKEQALQLENLQLKQKLAAAEEKAREGFKGLAKSQYDLHATRNQLEELTAHHQVICVEMARTVADKIRLEKDQSYYISRTARKERVEYAEAMQACEAKQEDEPIKQRVYWGGKVDSSSEVAGE